ncbi:OsmC family protein [Streptomyces sp. TRM 70351]|uniref:OsmC family protein n=1 Tax=Streptomyces sp. TRM 70351 TaxID=3116552 RepID=UPI002E7B1C92|nr:OsmC family protein [Streptomyces sp. TRM 70351]MEE1927444.1 OsmC family protein [Streptomyces sp. TRM 70351]
MTADQRTLYTTTARSLPGLERVQIEDEADLRLAVSTPAGLGGADGAEGWNPERLYAAALATCMHQAVELAAGTRGADTADSRVTARVALEHDGSLRYSFEARLTVELPRLDADERAAVIREAVRSCPMARGVEVGEDG